MVKAGCDRNVGKERKVKNAPIQTRSARCRRKSKAMKSTKGRTQSAGGMEKVALKCTATNIKKTDMNEEQHHKNLLEVLSSKLLSLGVFVEFTKAIQTNSPNFWG